MRLNEDLKWSFVAFKNAFLSKSDRSCNSADTSMKSSKWRRQGKWDPVKTQSSEAQLESAIVLCMKNSSMKHSHRSKSILILIRYSIGSVTLKRWKRIDGVWSVDVSKGCWLPEERQYLKTVRLWTKPKLKVSGGLTTAPAMQEDFIINEWRILLWLTSVGDIYLCKWRSGQPKDAPCFRGM